MAGVSFLQHLGRKRNCVQRVQVENVLRVWGGKCEREEQEGRYEEIARG